MRTTRTLSVLVAEDNELNRLIIGDLLDNHGHTYTMVEDGADAVAAVATTAFDLVLMDTYMPTMNGPDAARAIRALASDHASVPIVAISSDAGEEHAAAYRDAGMNGMIAKPIDLAAFARGINDALGEDVHTDISEPASEPSPEANPAAPTPEDKATEPEVSDFLAKLNRMSES